MAAEVEAARPMDLGFLDGGGDLGALIRGHDWAATPLGAPGTWPQSLRSALSICLNSSFPTAIYWGPELRLLYNDAWAPIPAERHPWALGRPGREVWADIWDVVGPQFARVVETGTGFSTYDQMLPMIRQGVRRETYWNYSITPIRGEDGSVIGIFNQGHETTDRVLGERRNRFVIELSDRLRSLSDPQAIIAAAQEALGRFLHANRVGYGEVDETARYFTTRRNWTDGSVPSREGMHDLAGFGPEVLASLRAGIPLLVADAARDPRTCAPESLAAFDAIDTRAAITASLVKDGRMRAALYVHARTPRPWTEHETGLVTEVAERTWAAVERARAESRLRESENRFRTMSDDAPVMSWITDSSGACTYLNRRWYEFTGQTPATAEGFGWLDAVHPDDRGWSSETFLAANARRESFRLEYRLRRRDGAYRWAIDAASPRFGADGEFLGYFGSVIDIHDRRLAETSLRELNETLESRVAERTAELMQAEEALRQAQKMEAVGQLTGGVAHDFNNLLTIIRSSVDFLRRPDLAEERRTRYVEAISDTVDRAAKLTGQLLAFARRQALKPEMFDAAERLRNVTDMLRTFVGARITVRTELGCDPCCVVADVSQFETALINMAVNARDAMGGEGVLTIRAEAVSEMPAIRSHAGSAGRFVAVSLTDTGTGIPPDRLTQIFEPFYTTKEVGKGTGLGLSQVYGFAKQSGGDVAVASTLGRGATFTLYLPRVDGTCPIDGGPATGGEEPAEHGSGRRVLVVEDNLDVGRFSTQILQDLGYETVWAVNADEALALLSGPGGFDAVFTDVVMPGMSGIELGQEIRRRHPDLPVLLTSGYSHVLAEEGRHGFELLQKPYAADALSRVLHRVIRARRRRAPT